MNERLYDAFEVCRMALATGVPLETALGLYPEQAPELRAALEAWQAASELAASPPEVPGIRVQRSRTRLLVRAAQLRGTTRPRGLALGGFSRLSLAALSVLLVVVLGWGGLATASAQALPGDTLYRLKRVDENLRLGLAGTSKRSDLETEFAERRSEEVRTLLALGRAHEIEFTGAVRSQSGEVWDVDGVRVFVGPEAEVDAGIVPGVTVEVEGNTDDSGNVRALEIRLAGYSWEGTVQAIGLQAWTVSGRVVGVDRATAIAPGIREGDRVLMLIDVLPGSVRARSILYLGPAGTGSAPTESRGDEWEFEGLVQTIGTQAWIIAGQTLIIIPETELDHSLQVGDPAKVKAQTTSQGRVIALEIARAEGGDGEPGEDPEGGSATDSSGEGEVGTISGEGSTPESGPGDSDNEFSEETKAPTEESFTGEVTSISGSVWTIAGQQVWVDQETEIKDDPDVGDNVRVDARLIDGRWVADKIEKR